MVSVSVKNINRLEIVGTDGSTYCGGRQEWYGRPWKRIAGCGPTVVAGIVRYLSGGLPESLQDGSSLSVGEFLALMEEAWGFVTPSVRGLPSPSALIKGAQAYLAYKNLPYTTEALDIPKADRLRPGFQAVLSFLESALLADTPVAFLSLDKGAEERLDSWHWVTLLSLTYSPDGSFAQAGVADEGDYFPVDLRKWYDTTPLGGGFVRFVRNPEL